MLEILCALVRVLARVLNCKCSKCRSTRPFTLLNVTHQNVRATHSQDENIEETNHSVKILFLLVVSSCKLQIFNSNEGFPSGGYQTDELKNVVVLY